MSDAGSALEGIAIVGVAGRFPGAKNVGEFWRNLCAGKETIRRFRACEAEDGFPPSVRAQPNYVTARGVLDEVDMFDAEFFGILARDAELTDPQHRVLLECAWEALEDAGHDPAAYPGAIGVFAGASMPTYFLRHVAADRGAVERFTSEYQVSSYNVLLGALPDALATRISYKLGLRGPSMTMQTACSTSLVTVAQACQSLWTYQADMALAGGVSITFPQRRGYLFQEGGMVAPDGRCRAFDQSASGTVFGSGAGLVLLKRLSDALTDRDHIYAVIRGIAVNNDGSAKVGFTAPSVDGQASVIAATHAMAGIDPGSIGYVECHGTGTPLGDPIEVAGLAKAFGLGRGASECALGSVKTNIGHLDVAAGVAGLIKTALAIKHGLLPPTLHFTAPNPNIAFADTPFFVNATLSGWPGPERVRRAGVSAFGVGGTNAHAVLEQAPPLPGTDRVGSAAPQLIVLSARSEAAVADLRTGLAAHLRDHPELDLADVAHTLQSGRRSFVHRGAWACSDLADAIAQLETKPPAPDVRTAGDRPPVVFMFPGQGSQFPGMGRELYRGQRVFRETIDLCAEILRPELGEDLRDILYSDSATELVATSKVQPALFSVEYALARLWIQWGVQPAAMVGHSVGEFVAATVAGVMELEDALRLVARRGALLQALPGGAMLAVRMPEDALMPMLEPPLALAAVNGPSLSVVAGPHPAVAELEEALRSRGCMFRRLQTSHAFHSPMMDPGLPALAEEARRLRLSPPQIPYTSGVTGGWITDEEATSPDYWARHCREPVRFAAGLMTVVDELAPVLLEVGPGRGLCGMAQQGAGRGLTVVASLAEAAPAETGATQTLAALGRLWAAGVHADWRQLHDEHQPRRVSLPTYPFQRRRYWVDPPARAQAADEPPKQAAGSGRSAAVNAAPAGPPVAAAASLLATVRGMLEALSGEDLSQAQPGESFLELGFDSLLLGQFVQQLHAEFGVTIGFRMLLSELPTMQALATHLSAALPPERIGAAAAPAAEAPAQSLPAAPAGEGADGLLERVMREQMRTMQDVFARQMEILAGPGKATSSPAALPPAPGPTVLTPSGVAAEQPSRLQVYAGKVSRGGHGSDMTSQQRSHIELLAARYAARTAGSKSRAQQARPTLADPRAAAGFRSEWKEIVYPIVFARAKGSRLWDVDGNEYVDLVNGYGQTAFGHAPDFVLDAIRAQLEDGFPIGPQSALAGEVSDMFCAMTGNERMTFCNTGSEAVMAAMRVARTVTGRSRIVMFTGDYHGQFDEVLAKGVRTGPPRAVPAVPGVPAGSVGNMVVLPYGQEESLAWVGENAATLAAVLVEPVQSRAPQLRPVEFVRKLREITAAAGTALVFDEVVTGFRVHPGGMQAVWDIRADLATYGKVMGGGMPIGVLAGASRFMDALDGGAWRYGDDSIPEVAPTFFAGTFVRHPLVLAACRAVLRHMQADGPRLLAEAAERTRQLAERLNRDFERRGLTTRANWFSSWIYVNFAGESPYANLIWHHLRDRGIHAQDGFPLFMTTEHTDSEVDRIEAAFRAGLDEMQEAGLLGASRTTLAAPPPAEAEAPLTPPQMEVLLSAQLGDDASCAFNESISLHLEGDLDRGALIGALQDVVARHDALRARLDLHGRRMVFLPRLDLDVQEVDASAGQGVLDAVIAREAETPFSLTEGKLIRAKLVRMHGQLHVLVLTAHHIVCDGWSTNVILDELAACYAARRTGAAEPLPDPLPFSRYALQLESAPSRPETERYWQDRFREPAPPLDLPSDRARPAEKSFRGATYRTRLARELVTPLKKAGARHGCTLFMTMLAGFHLLLGRLSGQTDVVVGVPTAAQSDLQDGALVGHCVNFLPVRARWDAGTSLAELLAHVREGVLQANDHKDTTLGSLVQLLKLPREPGRIPLAEVQFNLERLAPGLTFPGLRSRVEPNPKRFVNFDLFFNAMEGPDGVRVDVDFNTDLFDPATVARWMEAYEILLHGMLGQGDASVAAMPIMPEDDRACIERANDTVRELPRNMTVESLFKDQAVRTPDRTAVRCGDISLTYRQLDERTTKLALCLRARLAGLTVRNPARVALLLQRSCDLVTAILAVMRAGMSYVPIDPATPRGRLHTMLERSGAALVLTQGAAASSIDLPGLDLARDADEILGSAPLDATDLPLSGERPAYVIFTSGSTGSPKGVEVSHRSLMNLLLSMAELPGFTAEDRMLAVTTVGFDISGLELLLPLIRGGEVVVATEEELQQPPTLLRLLRQSGATVLQATPSLWRVLLEAGFSSHPSLRMLSGGEALDRALAQRLLAGGGELWNMYGPTETTIWSAACRIEREAEPITVGQPIWNTTFHILDPNLQPVPVGVTGELWIAGEGLALGYIGDPDLTDTAFPTLRVDGMDKRAYRTGDLARWMPAGGVAILGRRDTQVKLRGYRIELGEIEAALMRVPGVASCAAVVQTDESGHRQLACCFAAKAGQPVDETELRSSLAADLPAYMIPTRWIRLDAMPLNASGKIDRSSLGALAAPALAARPVVAPRTELEATLAKIWAEVLNVGVISVEENLFALGADSLHLFQIIARMSAAGIELSARHLLRNPTIAQVAAAWEAERDAAVRKRSAPTLASFRRAPGGAKHGGAAG